VLVDPDFALRFANNAWLPPPQVARYWGDADPRE